MNFQDVLTLLKAGYTKDEISAMTADNTAAPAQAAAPQQSPAPAETGTPAAQQTAPAAQQTESAPDLAGVLSKINDTLAALQAAAITGDSRGAATKPTAGQSLAKAITMTK